MGSDLDEVVDIKSSIAYLFVKWKLILLVAVICAVACGGYCVIKNSRSSNSADSGIIHEEKLKKARGALQESDALYVEQLSGQYKDYGKRLDEWNSYNLQSALQGMDPYNYIKRDIQYSVASDRSSAVNAFAASLLGQEDYEKLGTLMGYDPLTASLQDLVIVTDASQAGSSEAVAEQVAPDLSLKVVSINEGHSDGIINITCIINDEAAVEGVQEVIDAAVNRKAEAMSKAGINITVRKAGVTTSLNDAGWLLNKQKMRQQNISLMQTNRSDFVKNAVDTLPETQKAYFNLLIKDVTDGAQSASKSSKVNVKKFVLAGGIGGLILALAAVYLSYVFSEKIRSEEELRSNFKLSVLYRLTVGKEAAGPDVIRSKGLTALGAPLAGEGRSSILLKTELERRLAGKEHSSLFIAYDPEDEKVRGSMEALAAELTGDKMVVTSGNPFSDEKDCKELLKADAVVIAQMLNVSRKKTLKNLMETCRRNGIQILGCMTLFDAAKY